MTSRANVCNEHVDEVADGRLSGTTNKRKEKISDQVKKKSFRLL